jgi:16S rRNA (adenine1518-N6/adenine1519-N6)-dimethyltransferase
MLRNTLKGIVAPGAFEQLGIAPTARAETLGVAEFVALADAPVAIQGTP